VAEIVNGDLHVSPRPSPQHVLVASVLDGALGPPFHHGRVGPCSSRSCTGE
jgi:hypothetical protein